MRGLKTMWLKRDGAQMAAMPDGVDNRAAATSEDGDFVRDYERVAYKLGLEMSPAFGEWLSRSGIARHTETDVAECLDGQFGKNGAENKDQLWVWRDVGVKSGQQSAPRRPFVVAGGRAGYSGWGSYYEPYRKPIPYPVLLTIERVAEAFPLARFYISDETTPMEREADRVRTTGADPFLLAIVGVERYIIEWWDEPTFRARIR